VTDKESSPDNGGETTGLEGGELAELQKALVSKTDEAKAVQDKYLRLAAEFENYKRLSQKEQREFTRFANENILRELLPIIDNLERALKAAQDNSEEQPNHKSKGLIQGIELTLKQFLEVLTKFNVKPVASVGTPFDPACHQAVAHVESATIPENLVVEEYQKGYLLHDRILRAAMVTVSAGPTGNQSAAGAGQEESVTSSHSPGDAN